MSDNQLDNLNPHLSIDAINKRKAQQEAADKVTKANEEAYKRALNGLFSKPDGKVVYQRLKRYCKIMEVDAVLNPAQLVEDRGKKMVFIDMIYKYLEPKTLDKLEK